MKNFIFLAFFMLLMAATQCKKSDQPIDAPPALLVDTTEAYIRLNNEAVEYETNIVAYTYATWVNYEFNQTNGAFTNRLVFSGFPTKTTGDFGNSFDFSQTFDHDQNNHKYVQIEKETAFLKVTAYDVNTKTVRGSFKATFVRTHTGQQTTDSYLPDTLRYSGRFHTAFREY